MCKKWICQKELFSGARCGSGHCPPQGWRRGAEPSGVMGIPPGGSCILPTGTSLERGAGQAAELRDRLEPPAPAQPLRAGSIAGHVQGKQKPAERELSGRAVLPPAAPAFPLLLPLSIFFPFPALSAEGHLCRARGRQRWGHGQAQPYFKVARCREEQGVPGTPQRPALGTGNSQKGFPTLSSSHWTKPPGASPAACTAHFGDNVPDVGRNQDHSRATPTADPA